MSSPRSPIVLLGPQRGGGTLAAAAREVAGGGRAALVTAGWQEWEDDDDRLRADLGLEAVNLRLYARSEEIWREDSELLDGHRRLQTRVRLLRRAYNVRLARAVDAWFEMERMPGDAQVLDTERSSALDAVRALDAHHASRVRALREAFYAHYDPQMRPAVARQRDELEGVLEGLDLVVIAGGHLPALLNRLRLLGVDGLVGARPVVAFGAGAMVLAERVVFFHDTPPWGPGHAELGEVGLGLVTGVVALPHASTRLRLDDPLRMAGMARRFAPDACVLLDAPDRAIWQGGWRATRRLGHSGHAEPWEDAA